MRKLRALWLVLVSALIAGAIAASAALGDEFTVEQQPAALTASETPDWSPTFLINWGIFLCKGTSYSDVTASLPGTSITVTPTYSDCTMFNLPSPLDMNGCSYKLNLAGSGSTAGDIDLVCPAGNEVTYTMLPVKCTVHVKPQSDIGGTVKYSVIGAGSTREILVEAELKEIDYMRTQNPGLGACESGSGSNGVNTLKMTITAENLGGNQHFGLILS